MKGLISFINSSIMKSDMPCARVAELADALDLGSSGEIRRGSSPLSRTTYISITYISSASEILYL